MGWTDDRVEALKRLWADGLSAGQIAKQLGGVTRNAVIGKVHRLGLSGRAAPSKPARLDRPSRPARVVHETRLRIIPPGPPLPPPSPEPSDRPVVALMDLGLCMCRWPIGDPRDPGFGFCGVRTAEGRPYCLRHEAVAYDQKPHPTANQLMRALRRFAA
jgi:GcrA cell cycle regulator